MRACGIDFGTSNSAVAIAHAGKVALCPVEQDHKTLPSALFYPVGKPPVYGRNAIKQFSIGEDGRFMRSLKRMLGTSTMNYGTIVNDRPRRFEEIIGGFVSLLKTRAESLGNDNIDSVIMGRPVHFVDRDPEADFAAEAQLAGVARAAGFKHVEFQFEPIAAAFAHERHLTSEKLAIVVDIGGGTSDFTVIRLGPKHMDKQDRASDILGNAGTRIGGNDFDRDLGVAVVMPEFGLGSSFGARRLETPRAWFMEACEWSKINFLYTPKFRKEVESVAAESHAPAKLSRYHRLIAQEKAHLLLAATEAGKIALSQSDTAQIDASFIEDALLLPASRQQLEQAIAARLDAISASIAECLKKAGSMSEDIGLVVLTGGPSDMPAIKSLIVNHFPTAAISEDEKLASVALGLGHDAARRFG